MVRLPEFNGIEYLVERRFPAAKALRIPPSLSSLSARGGLSPEARKEAIARIEAYAAELSGKSPDELEALITAERGKEIAERKARAEHEERQRFFNQASANADFEHWSRSAHWTLDEAIALSFGKAPEHVTWDKVKPFLQISPFAFQYQRRRDLALRAVTWKRLFDPVLPGIFLAWAKRTDLTVPPELESAIAARGVQVADWKSLYDELKATINENRDSG